MQVEVTQENLSRALGVVGRVASGRTTLPILANILIEAGDSGLKLSTTNLEIGITHDISAKVEAKGKLTVPARLMQDFINSLPASNISLSTENNKLHISSGKFTSTINGVAADDFPSIPELNGGKGLKVSSTELKHTLNQILLAASADETRPVLTAVNFYKNDTNLVVVATDSYRLAEREIKKVKPSEQIELLIPARSLNELSRIIDSEDSDIEMNYDESQVQFSYGNTKLVSKLIDGKYPAYRELIPKENEISFTIARDELLRITKVASLFARESAGGITLHVSEDDQTVSIHSVASQVGENTSSADAKVIGSGEVTLNSRYLVEALGVIDAKEVEFGFSGKVNPCILRATGDEEYLHVVMPLRS